ncbi:MAG: flagellar hook-basal body complex protein FliE [Clostridiales bacterium]|nr:flagellar hook-basal body complex protein FliE [Clostridiales bacterium]MDW7663131.1 flagellar hook-basal body complex protein FliE [Bacillota bacterium]
MAINGIQSNMSITGNKLMEVNKALETNKVDFSELLTNALDRVNDDQINSQNMGEAFMLGEIDSLHDVTIAGMKADLSINLAVEVTNKLLSAYNEIMRLQL